jgi:hypothetical protein
MATALQNHPYATQNASTATDRNQLIELGIDHSAADKPLTAVFIWVHHTPHPTPHTQFHKLWLTDLKTAVMPHIQSICYGFPSTHAIDSTTGKNSAWSALTLNSAKN